MCNARRRAKLDEEGGRGVNKGSQRWNGECECVLVRRVRWSCRALPVLPTSLVFS